MLSDRSATWQDRGMATRRIGAEDSATRARLLDVAQQLLLDEGYAAVTSRRVAREAGLTPAIVHYYFRTMDDLFVAVFRRGAERNLARHTEALRSDPLRVLWALAGDATATTLSMEFAALANHRKVIRSELADYAERFRALQVDAVRSVLADDDPDAEAVVVGLMAVSQFLAMESTMGFTRGHDEVRALVERFVERLAE
jgi:AcrR family transcriptional regulator